MPNLVLRALLVGLGVLALEMLHGVFRVRVLNPRFGNQRGKQIGVFTGSALLFALAWLSSPWLIPSPSRADALLVGGIWLLMLLALDIAVGKWLFRFRWNKILDDFNPAKGSLLLFGMIFALICPLLVLLLQPS